MTEVVTERELRTVVFLKDAPSGVGEALRVLFREAADQIPAGLAQLTVNIGEAPMTLTLIAQPLAGPEFDYAVAQSPHSTELRSAVAVHNAYLLLTTPAEPEVFAASARLSTVTAYFAYDDNGVAVWLPDADYATTDVHYANAAGSRPAVVWFNTMAAMLDETTAIAHTIGLQSLGGSEVQLRKVSATPADTFRELQDAVATMLEGSALPAADMTLTIADTPHRLVAGTSEIGFGDVLEVVSGE